MSYPTIGRLKRLIEGQPDHFLIVAIGVTQSSEIKLNLAETEEQAAMLFNPKAKWQRRIGTEPQKSPGAEHER
jgi:hypothetical protein